MVDSRKERPFPVAVTEFPIDESPYGVRGLAGNVRDWCLDADPVTGRRFNRGGFWIGGARECRAADRHIHEETHRTAELGFRLARSWSP
jgi:serine/threonine-protein kinase